MKTFYFCSAIPCLRTRTNCQKIYNYLITNRFHFTKNFSKADIIIIDTCGYCKSAEDISIKIIQYYLKHKRKSSRFIVVGCLPEINPNRLRSISNFEMIGPKELNRLDKLIKAEIKFKSIPEPVEIQYFDPEINKPTLFKGITGFFSKVLPKKDKSLSNCYLKPFQQKVFHINISRGCLGNCAYCATKYAMGRVKSKSITNIIKEFKTCLNKKAKIIYLETEDLGCYGLDINTTIVELLESLFKIKGNYKLLLHDFNPYWFIKYYPAIKEILVKNSNKIEYLNIPVESGSDRILRLMNRPYCIENVKETLFDLKTKAPNLEIWCNIMIGFPSETEKDFKKTKEFVKELKTFKLTEIWITPYTDRPNTIASKMNNKINRGTVNQRYLELQNYTRNKRED